jgi:molybdopterin synthase catalytic subunit
VSASRVIRVQRETFSPETETASLTLGRTDIGAIVTFAGLCRDEGGVLTSLEIEHYPGMAEEEIGRVVDEALTRWPLQGVTVIHRYGTIAPGEPIVLVITASRHRAEAFAAASFLMDYLKTKAPFWKKQNLAGASGGWVAARREDETSAENWAAKPSLKTFPGAA